MEQTKQVKLLEGTYIKQALKNVAIKLYPVIAPESAGNNYMVYNRKSTSLLEPKSRQTGLVDSLYDINIVTEDYSKGINFAVQVIDGLQKYRHDDIVDVQLIDISEKYIETSYIQTIQVKIINK